MSVIPEPEHVALLPPLAVASVTIIATVIIHMFGLIALMGLMQKRWHALRPRQSLVRQGLFVVLVVLGLVFIHGLEIWLYAAVYLLLGAIGTLEEALYFSASSFTTVGFGDIVLESRWRLVAALEGVSGFLLIGWSTAFLVSVTGRLRSAALDWLDEPREG